jgi:hypothetical protein
MVMGHSIQPNGKIASHCNGSIVLIDVQISRFGRANGGHCGVLEILPDGKMNALYCSDRDGGMKRASL